MLVGLWLLLVGVLGPLVLLAPLVLLVPRVRRVLPARRHDGPRWRTTLTVGAGTVVALGALVAVALLAPAGALPLPPGAGAWVVATYEGRAAVPDPITGLGDGPGNGPAGPVGDSPEVASRWYAGADCGDLVDLPAARLAAVCVRGDESTLRVVGDDLGSGAERSLPTTRASASSVGACGRAVVALGGGRVAVATSTGALEVLATVDAAGAPDLTLLASLDLGVPDDDCPVSLAAAPGGGSLWWASAGGLVGFVRLADPTRPQAVGRPVRLSGEVTNAITTTGPAAYVVTTDQLASVALDDAGRPQVVWRSVYDTGTRVRSGQLSVGSGTPPVLLAGTAASGPLLAITDNADPRVHLQLYGRSDGALVCQQAVFDDESSAVEAPPVAVGPAAVVVANAAGWDAPTRTLLGRAPTGGLARVDLVDGECRTTWTADVVAPSVPSTLSPQTGLVYAWATRHSWWGVSAWWLTAIEASTGRVRYAARAGIGTAWSGRRGGLHLGADGAAYLSVVGGLARVADRAVTSSSADPRHVPAQP